MVDLILFPSDFFDTSKVDEDLQEEYEAVKETGLFDVVFFGYDSWFREGRLVLNEAPSEMRSALMRGWMMKPQQYEAFYEALLQQNIQLITTPKEYELMHIFPNVHSYFGEDTARMSIYPLHEQIDIAEVKKLTYKKGIAICGNVDCSKIQTGTDDEIRESALYAIESGKPGGGYIFCSSNCVFKGVSFEKYKVYHDVWKEHRNY